MGLDSFKYEEFFTFRKFLGQNPESWLEIIDEDIDELMIPVEKQVSYASQFMLGSSHQWLKRNLHSVLLMNWCDFSYSVLWEFGSTTCMEDAEQEELMVEMDSDPTMLAMESVQEEEITTEEILSIENEEISEKKVVSVDSNMDSLCNSGYADASLPFTYSFKFGSIKCDSSYDNSSPILLNSDDSRHRGRFVIENKLVDVQNAQGRVKKELVGGTHQLFDKMLARDFSFAGSVIIGDVGLRIQDIKLWYDNWFKEQYKKSTLLEIYSKIFRHCTLICLFIVSVYALGTHHQRWYLLCGSTGTSQPYMIVSLTIFMPYDVFDLELPAVKNDIKLQNLLGLMPYFSTAPNGTLPGVYIPKFTHTSLIKQWRLAGSSIDSTGHFVSIGRSQPSHFVYKGAPIYAQSVAYFLCVARDSGVLFVDIAVYSVYTSYYGRIQEDNRDVFSIVLVYIRSSDGSLSYGKQMQVILRLYDPLKWETEVPKLLVVIKILSVQTSTYFISGCLLATLEFVAHVHHQEKNARISMITEWTADYRIVPHHKKDDAVMVITWSALRSISLPWSKGRDRCKLDVKLLNESILKWEIEGWDITLVSGELCISDSYTGFRWLGYIDETFKTLLDNVSNMYKPNLLNTLSITSRYAMKRSQEPYYRNLSRFTWSSRASFVATN